jgi:site-specific recombinase XerD
MKHLSETQIKALMATANETVQPSAADRSRLIDRNRLLFLMTYEHGLRISETLGLTRAHLRRGYLSIKGKKKGKRADERVNPSTLELWDKVTATLAPNTLVFPISRQFASELFHRACDAAGIQLQLRQGVHSLRHSLAHHLLDCGAPLPVVQKSLRHRSIGSTGCYLEADGESVDKWRQKATIGGSVAAPVKPMSINEVRAEMKRLSELMLAMQDVQDEPEPAPVAVPAPDVASAAGD